VDDELGEIDIQFFPDRFEDYLHHLRATKSPRTHKMRSNATVNRVIEITRAAYNTGVALGFVETNPITKVRFPRLKELPRDVILSELEKQNLLNVIDKEAPHLSAVVRFALQVPCRRSELVRMRKEDLDLIHNAIRVKAENSKNDKGCWKPIPPDMVEYFRSLPRETDYLFYRKDEISKPGFTTWSGLGDFHGAWRRCLKLAKLENFRFHDTRHCSASALVNNGTPEQVVMDVANWKTNMLRKYYHREPIQSLKLVRFSPSVPMTEDHAERIAANS
jgi:integrase